MIVVGDLDGTRLIFHFTVWFVEADAVVAKVRDLLQKRKNFVTMPVCLVSHSNFQSSENDSLCFSLEHVSSHPHETPNVSFRADVAAMREAVHKFGRIDSSGVLRQKLACHKEYFSEKQLDTASGPEEA